jgi:hypothetical protein
MSTGDKADIAVRIRSKLPPWFDGAASPVVDGFVQGAAWALSCVYSLYAYAQTQTRIKSATDGWLDLIAADFFGSKVTRSQNQSDTSFLARIIANLFRERNTRNAITSVLTAITGRPPRIIEPWNPGDTGAWDMGLYWDSAGYWGGDSDLPYQSFVTAYRPLSASNTDLAGWDVPTGGWDTGVLFWADELSGAVTDADIIAAVESVRMAGTIIWLDIES